MVKYWDRLGPLTALFESADCADILVGQIGHCMMGARA